LHTDTADWEPPVELISMVCVRADPDGGGRSRIPRCRLDTQRSKMSDSAARFWSSWKRKRCPGNWRATGAVGFSGVPILTPSRVCWRRYTIDLRARLDWCETLRRHASFFGKL
jgi:hypothetical protein